MISTHCLNFRGDFFLLFISGLPYLSAYTLYVNFIQTDINLCLRIPDTANYIHYPRSYKGITNRASLKMNIMFPSLFFPAYLLPSFYSYPSTYQKILSIVSTGNLENSSSLCHSPFTTHNYALLYVLFPSINLTSAY